MSQDQYDFWWLLIPQSSAFAECGLCSVVSLSLADKEDNNHLNMTDLTHSLQSSTILKFNTYQEIHLRLEHQSVSELDSHHLLSGL